MELKAAAGRYFRRSFSAAAGHVESVAQVRAPSGLRKQHPPATGADVATQTVAASGSGPDCRSAVSQVKAPACRVLTAANRVPSRSNEASDGSATAALRRDPHPGHGRGSAFLGGANGAASIALEWNGVSHIRSRPGALARSHSQKPPCSNGSDACQPLAQPRRREIRGAAVSGGRAPAQRMNLEQVPDGGRIRGLRVSHS